MNVLILHGILGKAGENWMQWLSDELTSRSYNVFMPNLPNADHPNRSQWLETIKHTIGANTDDLIIVGHSLGVTSALDYIEQSPTKIKAIVSVSGFATDYGLELNSYFLRQHNIDFKKVNTNLEKAFVFYGNDDPYVTQDALAFLANELNAEPTIINNGDHLNKAAGFTKFPEVLNAVLSVK